MPFYDTGHKVYNVAQQHGTSASEGVTAEGQDWVRVEQLQCRAHMLLPTYSDNGKEFRAPPTSY